MENVLTASRTEEAVAIGEAADVAAARRAGTDLARRHAFPPAVADRLALVITEAATNILKHAGRGEILLRTIRGRSASGAQRGIEMLAIDGGAGIADASHAMVDGHSTAGTYGVGLGAIKRQSHSFDVFSLPDNGTVLRAVLWESASMVAEDWQCGLVCTPLPGEQRCGDAGWASAADDVAVTMISDGLGHGDAASDASETALGLISGMAFALPPADLMLRMHAALQKTRGAAVAIARIDHGSGTLLFAGVGNIAACTVLAAQRRHLVSHNGIVGHNLRKVHQFDSPWQDGMLLILHSDGLASRWSLEDYPGLEQAHPAIIAAVLYRDFYRGRDDVSVLVIRKGETP